MSMKVNTARSILKYRGMGEYLAWLAGRAAHRAYDRSVMQAPDNIDEEDVPAVAFLQEGDWIAECPSGCGAAMWIEPGQPFMCAICWNVQIGGRWRMVVWPKDREAIESEILKRPIHVTGNWLPGETVEDLQRENTEHGIV